MERVLSDGLWEDLRKRARKAKKKRAAIAYFTENHLSLGRGDLLVVDASDGAIKSQATNAFLLEAMHSEGVSIYSLPGLHSKVALLDNVAVIGSANSSAHSEDRLIEASLVSDSPFIVAKVQQLIDGWVEDAGRMLDRSDLKRLLGLPTTPRTWLPSTTRKRRKGGHGSGTVGMGDPGGRASGRCASKRGCSGGAGREAGAQVEVQRGKGYQLDSLP